MTATKDQAYAEVERIVRQRANAYCRAKPFADRDEVYAEAAYAYAKTAHKAPPGARTTFAAWVVDLELKNFARKKVRENRLGARTNVEFDAATADHRFDPADLLYDLRRDAADIVSLLLSAPGEMWEAVVTTADGKKSTPLGAKHRLARFLTGLGWDLKRVKAAFREIAEALAS